MRGVWVVLRELWNFNAGRLIRRRLCKQGHHEKVVYNPNWCHRDGCGFDWECKWCDKEGEVRYEDVPTEDQVVA